MARGKSKGNDAVDRAAEAIGHALGSVVGTIESLQERHPHPVEEAREAVAAGQETLAAAASETGTRAAAMIKKAKAIARRPKKAATRARRKEYAGGGPCDAHGAEDGEGREESRQARSEDRETGREAPEALVAPTSESETLLDVTSRVVLCGRRRRDSRAISAPYRFSAATCPGAHSPRGTPFPTPRHSACASRRHASSRDV